MQCHEVLREAILHSPAVFHAFVVFAKRHLRQRCLSEPTGRVPRQRSVFSSDMQIC